MTLATTFLWAAAALLVGVGLAVTLAMSAAAAAAALAFLAEAAAKAALSFAAATLAICILAAGAWMAGAARRMLAHFRQPRAPVQVSCRRKPLMRYLGCICGAAPGSDRCAAPGVPRGRRAAAWASRPRRG